MHKKLTMTCFHKTKYTPYIQYIHAIINRLHKMGRKSLFIMLPVNEIAHMYLQYITL